MYPDASADDADLILEETGMRWRLFDTAADSGGVYNAFEVNGSRGAVDRIVRLAFAGYGPEGDPTFVFSYTPPAEEEGIRPHDHRDNFGGGGFAFSVFHPGTSLPQARWGY